MVTLGLALPHYDDVFPDPGVTGAARTRAALDYASMAERAGLHEIWVSDHLWLDMGDGARRASPDCWTLLAALAVTTQRIRIGSLVTPAPLRPSGLFAHQVSTVVDLAGDRLDIGLGAGWHAAEFDTAGVPFGSAEVRLAALESCIGRLRAKFGSACPPIWVGGKGSRTRALANRLADGWNLAWNPNPEAVWRMFNLLVPDPCRSLPCEVRISIGLTTVIATDEADLRRRWGRIRAWAPAGHFDRVNFRDWRATGLVGTVAEVSERLGAWAGLGVDHVVCASGMPFGMFDDEQIELIARLQPD